MIAIIASAILFGLVHPGSKLLMNQGLDFLPFCFLYIAIRFIAQLPLVFAKKAWKIRTRQELVYLISIGVVGALLQLAEFSGIYNGLPVGVVSFLVYTHPVWTVLLSRLINGESISRTSVKKLTLAIIGILLITGFRGGVSPILFIGPLAAGFLIALWISLSNKASKAGCSASSISFYYDAFAFVILGSIMVTNRTHSFHEIVQFLSNFNALVLMVGYSILVGYLPNFLFYWGSKRTSTQIAGFTLLLEPVISTSVSHFAWQEPVNAYFLVGALLILATNLPLEHLKKVFSRVVSIAPEISISSAYLALFLLVIPNHGLSSVHIVEIVPSDSSDYTVTKELTQLRVASNFSASDFREHYPQCKSQVVLKAHRGSEAELYSTLKTISREKHGIVIGLSRTNFARLAAKALEGSKVKGLSVGAAFANLKDINPNFGTIISPWQRQWDVIFSRIKKQNCNATNSIGFFDDRNVLSQSFQEQFERNVGGKVSQFAESTPGDFTGHVGSAKCLFVALNFSDANAYLTKLIRNKWSGTIIGIGDWNYYSVELNKIVKLANYRGLSIYMPTGWIPEASDRSKAFASRMTKATGESPSPLSAYTYDATWIALEYACNQKDPLKMKAEELSKLPLLRQYEGISDKGNYLSKMFEITKGSKK